MIPIEQTPTRRARPATLSPLVSLLTEDSSGRARTESWIAEKYRSCFGAEVMSFHPTLLEIRAVSGDLFGCAGYRRAADHELFLEQYLRDGVEMELARRLGVAVTRREQIVEIGNFAATAARSVHVVFAALDALLRGLDVHYAVFSATEPLRRLLTWTGTPFEDLGPVDPSRLQDSAVNWGTYYERNPRLSVISHTSPPRAFEGDVQTLWHACFDLGRERGERAA